jgi:hypothetical protein
MNACLIKKNTIKSTCESIGKPILFQRSKLLNEGRLLRSMLPTRERQTLFGLKRSVHGGENIVKEKEQQTQFGRNFAMKDIQNGQEKIKTILTKSNESTVKTQNTNLKQGYEDLKSLMGYLTKITKVKFRNRRVDVLSAKIYSLMDMLTTTIQQVKLETYSVMNVIGGLVLLRNILIWFNQCRIISRNGGIIRQLS